MAAADSGKQLSRFVAGAMASFAFMAMAGFKEQAEAAVANANAQAYFKLAAWQIKRLV